MGQTLTHGIYLPDEGERNCYNGLAANWSILDGAVGTVAEHSTQIAGKAPAVHTHTKSDITDFPALANVATSGSYNDLSNIPASFTPSSHTHGNLTNDGKIGTTANVPLITGTDGVVQAGSFGNSANTFCEGNDSRLSDARTPVAHTHTKSDVTDLLNSNFIPSADNSYDLGSSSYQWNNLYAKSYYYNGVAWGLDKANEWTGINTFSAVSYGEKIQLKNTGLDLSNGNPAVSSICQYIIWWNDKNNTHYAKIHAWANDTNSSILLTSYYRADANTVITSTLRNQCGSTSKSFFPESNSDTDLGTSTNKWKTFNGVNPGALSLPDVFDSYDVITTNWNTAYSQPNNLQINGANPSYPGWLYIRLDNCTAEDDFLIVRYYATFQGNLTFFGSFIPTSSSYVLSVPIQAGITTKVWVSKIPTYCKYYACLGTVK